MTSSEEQAPSGWYPDPYQPGRLRYFDGAAWTDHFHYEGRLPDIGTWLSSTFNVLGQHALASFGLAAGLAVVGSLIGWIALKVALDDWAVADEEFVNVSAGGVAFGVLALLLYALWQGFSWLAVNRFFQLAHLQEQPTVADSLQRALTRLPKLIGVYLVMAAAAVAVFVVFLVLALASWALAILAAFALMVAMVWVFVKLSFLSATVVAAPEGTPAMQASARVSTGRFWGVLGRLMLLGLGLAIASGIVNGVFGGLGSPIDQNEFSSVFEVDDDEVIINDVLFADLIPSAGDFVVYLIVSTIVGSITTVISTSAIMRLYLDSGGPSEI